MIDTNINSSEITSPSANYVFSVIAEGVDNLSNVESKDIIMSLFGITNQEMTAIDITSSIINMIGERESLALQKLLIDQSAFGVLWNFTTPNKFMVQLSKVPTHEGNQLCMTLIAVQSRDAEPTSVIVRELVRWNGNVIEFQDRRLKSVEFAPDISDELNRLHNERMASLEAPAPEESKKEDWITEEPELPNEPVQISIVPDAVVTPETLPPTAPDTVEEDESEQNNEPGVPVDTEDPEPTSDDQEEPTNEVNQGTETMEVVEPIINCEDGVPEQVVRDFKNAIINSPDTDPSEIEIPLESGDTNSYILNKQSDGSYFIEIVPATTESTEEAVDEEPTVDISDPAIQAQLMSSTSVFGTPSPAITHLNKFLNAHHTEEKTASYLATNGTFPTETDIIWRQKPWDVTLAIVKMMDGKFYRMFIAKTNNGLSDHSWIGTKDMPDRWVRFGNDIQNTIARNEQIGSGGYYRPQRRRY